MKIFRVVVERDGVTTKIPGNVTTEIVRSEYRYGAESIAQVWDAIEWIRDDVESTVIALHEEHPAITILQQLEIEP